MNHFHLVAACTLAVAEECKERLVASQKGIRRRDEIYLATRETNKEEGERAFNKIPDEEVRG